MKILWILRHAAAEVTHGEIADHDRPLSPRGAAEAAAIAGRLAGCEGRPERIICSTARRARETAEAVARVLGGAPITATRRLYLADAAECLAVVRETPEPASVLLLAGHNPGLEALVGLLARRPIGLGTATLVRLDVSLDRWADLGPVTVARPAGTFRPEPL